MAAGVLIDTADCVLDAKGHDIDNQGINNLQPDCGGGDIRLGMLDDVLELGIIDRVIASLLI